MALTKLSTDGVKDDAVNGAKIAPNSIGASEIQNSIITNAKLADQAVTLAKLEHGTSDNDGKFLRANNGADPTFETVTGTTINNNADNRVITGSGTANTLNAESGVVIDSSGRLLLGVTTPTMNETGFNEIVLGGKSEGAAIHLQDDNSNVRGGLFTSDANNSMIVRTMTSHPLNFRTNNTERMRIDASGKVGIGTSSPETLLHVEGSGDTKATIETTANSNAGLRLRSSNCNILIQAGQAVADNLRIYNESTSSELVRILAGGGLTFNGDTAAANALDDYEEGTFNATCSNSVTIHASVNACTYTKIGRQVTVRGQVRINNNNNSADLEINNLPFTNYDSDGEDSSLSVGAVRIWNQNVPSDTINPICLVVGQNTNLQFWINRDDTTAERMKANANAYVAFTITYFAI
tara:strand:- start:299 stop:1525 length:1227 start_codon:yes stop_codon:yes gene_type:complete